ncbi:MAG: hypothetical protein P4L84_14530 [Isosphaeraceae bacterium]|nr:hypothetical protein [Isosphaeraceae bacterium]
MAYERTLVQIRERSFLDLQELALLVIRRRPLPLLLALVAATLPFVALNAWLAEGGGSFALFACYLVLPTLEAPLATAGLTVLLGGLMFGERPSAGQVVRASTAALVPILLYQVVLRPLLLLLPGRLAFINEVLLLERGPWHGATGRSAQLCTGSVVDLFLHWIGAFVFASLFLLCFLLGTGAVLNALFTSELTWDRPTLSDLGGFQFQVGLWLVIGFFAVVRFLTYIDQRIRLEGWEVELRLRSAGRALEEAATW